MLLFLNTVGDKTEIHGKFRWETTVPALTTEGKTGFNLEAKGSLTEQLEHQILRPLGDHHEFQNALPKHQASPTSSIALCPCCHAPLCQHAFVAWVLEYVTLPLEVLMRLRRSYDFEYRVRLSKILCAYTLKRP